MLQIAFDIETIPQDGTEIRAEVEAAVDADIKAAQAKICAQYKQQATIDKHLANIKVQSAEDRQHDMGLCPETGQIICISAALDDEKIRSFYEGTEADILVAFFSWIGACAAKPQNRGIKPTLIAHNGNGFDIPYVWKRAKILGVKLPWGWPSPVQVKPWGDTRDTSVMWCGNKGRVSQDRLSRLLGIKSSKGGMGGDEVWSYYRAGRLSEIVSYCEDDVRCLREIYSRLK